MKNSKLHLISAANFSKFFERMKEETARERRGVGWRVQHKHVEKQEGGGGGGEAALNSHINLAAFIF